MEGSAIIFEQFILVMFHILLCRWYCNSRLKWKLYAKSLHWQLCSFVTSAVKSVGIAFEGKFPIRSKILINKWILGRYQAINT